MATINEYIDQLLAEIQIPEPAQKVVRNILDEPIPKARAFHRTPYSKRQEWSSSCSQIMTSTCSSRGECAEASQWSQSAMPKPTVLWSMATAQKSLAATPSTWTQITSMVGPWASPYPRAPSGGKKTASSLQKPLQIIQQTIQRALHSR